jgi:hypothetical protein
MYPHELLQACCYCMSQLKHNCSKAQAVAYITLSAELLHECMIEITSLLMNSCNITHTTCMGTAAGGSLALPMYVITTLLLHQPIRLACCDNKHVMMAMMLMSYTTCICGFNRHAVVPKLSLCTSTTKCQT